MAITKTQPTVHLLCGLACAGKTTLAREIEARENAVRFTLDEWMTTLTDFSIFDPEYGRYAARCREMIWKTAVRLLKLGIDVVLDWSLWNREMRRQMKERIEAVGAQHKLYYLNIPHNVLLERLAARNTHRPEHVHVVPEAEFRRFAPLFEPPAEDEGLNVVELYLGYNRPIHNPHLEGGPFFWEGGPVGILLLHGLTATTAEVRLLAEKLCAAGYTIAAPLLPGHGTTPEQLNETTWRDWAWEAEMSYQHLATVCDHVFVGGESTGAVLALYLASKYAEIAGVLAYAPAISLAMPVSDIVRLYVSYPLVDAIPKKRVNDNPYWQGYRVYPLRGVIELIRLGREAQRRLAQIEQPVLVVQGRNDATIAPESGQIICQGVRSEIAELHWMEESGHVIILEDELDQVAQLTLQFIQRILAM